MTSKPSYSPRRVDCLASKSLPTIAIHNRHSTLKKDIKISPLVEKVKKAFRLQFGDISTEELLQRLKERNEQQETNQTASAKRIRSSRPNRESSRKECAAQPKRDCSEPCVQIVVSKPQSSHGSVVSGDISEYSQRSEHLTIQKEYLSLPHTAPNGVLRRSPSTSGNKEDSIDMHSALFQPRRTSGRRHSTRATKTLQPMIGRLHVQRSRNSTHFTHLSQEHMLGGASSTDNQSTHFTTSMRHTLPYRKKAVDSFTQQAFFAKTGRKRTRPFNGMSSEAQHAINETRKEMGLPLLTREETLKLQSQGQLPSIHRSNGVASRSNHVAFAENVIGGLTTTENSSMRATSTFESSLEQLDRHSCKHQPLKTEKTFEITPLGFDSRFKKTVALATEESTPEEVMSQSVAKCNEWLNKYS